MWRCLAEGHTPGFALRAPVVLQRIQQVSAHRGYIHLCHGGDCRHFVLVEKEGMEKDAREEIVGFWGWEDQAVNPLSATLGSYSLRKIPRRS